MKLKKLLALALAGVMAVSMMAGCKGGNKTEDPTEEPTGDTSIAAALNEKQEDNDVKVNFVYDNTIEDAMNKYMDVNGAPTGNGSKVVAYLQDVLDVDATVRVSNFNGYDDNANAFNTKKDETQTEIVLVNVSGMTNAGAANEVYGYNGLDDALAELVAENEGAAGDGLEYSFEYAGKVAMVTVEDNNMVKTYVAVVVTCTTKTALV